MDHGGSKAVISVSRVVGGLQASSPVKGGKAEEGLL